MKTYFFKIIDFFNLVKVREKFEIKYQNIIFFGLFALLLIYINSNHLLIPLIDLIIVGITSSVIITLIFFRFYRKRLSIMWALFHNLFLGLIVVYFFILTNNVFSRKPSITEKLYIEEVKLDYNGGRNSGYHPTIKIKIRGKTHKISYHKARLKEVIKAKEAIVTLKEGFWGYWVVMDVQLIIPN